MRSPVPEISADSELMARIMSLDFSTRAAGIGGTAPRIGATEQPIDTGTAAGKCFLDMLGVFAEFETNLRRER